MSGSISDPSVCVNRREFPSLKTVWVPSGLHSHFRSEAFALRIASTGPDLSGNRVNRDLAFIFAGGIKIHTRTNS
jgi:hypothetical protein